MAMPILTRASQNPKAFMKELPHSHPSGPEHDAGALCFAGPAQLDCDQGEHFVPGMAAAHELEMRDAAFRGIAVGLIQGCTPGRPPLGFRLHPVVLCGSLLLPGDCVREGGATGTHYWFECSLQGVSSSFRLWTA